MSLHRFTTKTVKILSLREGDECELDRRLMSEFESSLQKEILSGWNIDKNQVSIKPACEELKKIA